MSMDTSRCRTTKQWSSPNPSSRARVGRSRGLRAPPNTPAATTISKSGHLMRLAPLLVMAAFLVAVTATSGCIFSCDIHGRDFTREQDDMPLEPSGLSTEYELGDLWGGVIRSTTDNKLIVNVHGYEPVSHDEAVEFTESLFASKGWPEPRLEGAAEYAGCDDDF